MLVRSLLDWAEVTPSSHKLALCLLILVAISAVMYGIVLGPRWNQVEKLEHEVFQLDQTLKIQEGYEHRRQKLMVEVASLQERIQEQRETLGIALSQGQVLSDISHAARQAGVSLISWKPEVVNLENEQEVVERRIRLEVGGTYHGLTWFLGLLSRLPKAMVVQALSIMASQSEQNQGTIMASIDLLGYEISVGLGMEKPKNAL